MQSRSWEKDGQKHSKVEVLANDVTFVDSRGEGGGSEGGNFGGDGGGNSAQAPSRSSSSSNGGASSSKKKDEVVEDIGDEPINLDDIPF
jgi:single-strand DNA-binding protein